mmetsp:Transcript_9971/g.32034  ORF Transcript_9971/g.32034 Transcript_9971/m.32034 type:complete len:260 (+) Transcript_9971:503-1282(+)
MIVAWAGKSIRISAKHSRERRCNHSAEYVVVRSESLYETRRSASRRGQRAVGSAYSTSRRGHRSHPQAIFPGRPVLVPCRRVGASGVAGGRARSKGGNFRGWTPLDETAPVRILRHPQAVFVDSQVLVPRIRIRTVPRDELASRGDGNGSSLEGEAGFESQWLIVSRRHDPLAVARAEMSAACRFTLVEPTTSPEFELPPFDLEQRAVRSRAVHDQSRNEDLSGDVLRTAFHRNPFPLEDHFGIARSLRTLRHDFSTDF